MVKFDAMIVPRYDSKVCILRYDAKIGCLYMIPRYDIPKFVNQFRLCVEKLLSSFKVAKGRIVARGAVERVDIRHFSIQNFFINFVHFFPFHITRMLQRLFRDPMNLDSRVFGIDKAVLEVF